MQFSQSEGWTRLNVPPLQGYQHGRYTAIVNGMVVEALGLPDRSTILSIVLRAIDDRLLSVGQPERRETLVAVQDGMATLRAGSDGLTVFAGQAVTQSEAQRLVGPRALPLDYVHNGAFARLGVAGGKTVWPEGWRQTSDQGGDGGELWGSTDVVHEQIDGRSQPIVVFDRRVNAKDNAVHGIQQRLDMPLAPFQTLLLKARLQVRYHSLSGGGIADSEYPIIVKITYRDRLNRSVAWYRGFYTHNEQKLPVPNGVRVGQDEWFTFTQDLLRLGPKNADSEPVFLETLDIYAAGHDFSGAVASVAIEGE